MLYLNFGLPEKRAGSNGYLISLRLSFDNGNGRGAVDILVVLSLQYKNSTDFERNKLQGAVKLEGAYYHCSRWIMQGSHLYGKIADLPKAKNQCTDSSAYLFNLINNR